LVFSDFFCIFAAKRGRGSRGNPNTMKNISLFILSHNYKILFSARVYARTRVLAYIYPKPHYYQCQLFGGQRMLFPL
jgi:hypothetical protein